MGGKTYYQRHREQLLNYSKERYRQNHPRKYKKYYLVITPEGKELEFDRAKDLAEFFGYSSIYHTERLHGKFGYKVQKVY